MPGPNGDANSSGSPAGPGPACLRHEAKFLNFAKKLLWDITPDERYVAPPSKGSRHNRGAAVDLTLVDAQGRELPMPTEYDAFSVKAHRSYGDLLPEQKQNRARLEDAMKAAGFVPLSTEWWHFDDPDSGRYPLAEIGFDELLRARAAPK